LTSEENKTRDEFEKDASVSLFNSTQNPISFLDTPSNKLLKKLHEESCPMCYLLKVMIA